MMQRSELNNLLDEFGRRGDVRFCSTSEGAFNNCMAMCQRFIRFLWDRGYAGKLVRLQGSPHFPRALPEWTGIPPCDRVHYVVQVGDWYVDYTARQFDPCLIAHPHLLTEGELGDWDCLNVVCDGEYALRHLKGIGALRYRRWLDGHPERKPEHMEDETV